MLTELTLGLCVCIDTLEDIFRRRFLEEPGIAADSLQETFINTTAAWINMLLVSSSGPIKVCVLLLVCLVQMFSYI